MNISKHDRPKVIVLCGPTGIGKTELSLELAEEFGGCIVSADSMQVYRFMDIGTAKPGLTEQARVPHYMIDVADPDEPFDAAEYAGRARACIDEIESLGRLPLVIGGTGLYIKALLHGLCRARPSSPEIRARLSREAEEKGARALYDRLSSADPETAGSIHPNDLYRIKRALEVYELTGRPISHYRRAHGFREDPYDALKICLSVDRQTLYERIDRRVDRMVSSGLLDEVRGLLKKGYFRELKSMNALGYRHMADYLYGELDWDEALRLMKRDTRRYAKRQLVWFRKDRELLWMDPGDMDSIRVEIRKFLGRA